MIYWKIKDDFKKAGYGKIWRSFVKTKSLAEQGEAEDQQNMQKLAWLFSLPKKSADFVLILEHTIVYIYNT